MSAPEQTRPGGYRRSPNGLLGATIITVVAVLAFVGFRSLWRTDPATPVRAVNYTISLKAARDAHQLLAVAPASLPSGWKATSASYTPGAQPAWHLGVLTSQGKYVGIEESTAPLSGLISTYVDANATQGKDVTIAGTTYQTWTDRGGDYALARSVKVKGQEVESYVVVGSAPDAQIRSFAASLEHGTGPKTG